MVFLTTGTCVVATHGKLGGPNSPLQPGLLELAWAALFFWAYW